MEIYSYFVVWIDKDNKERYSFVDIEVDRIMDIAETIHELLIYAIQQKHQIASVRIKHVSLLKTSK